MKCSSCFALYTTSPNRSISYEGLRLAFYIKAPTASIGINAPNDMRCLRHYSEHNLELSSATAAGFNSYQLRNNIDAI